MSHYPITATQTDARDNEGFIAASSETSSWKVGVMSERVPFLHVTKFERSFLQASSHLFLSNKSQEMETKQTKNEK